jgi:DNA transformation protein and related proteins
MKKKARRDERRISEMRNLGPTCEKDLNAVGIQTAQDLIDAGAIGAFQQMLFGRMLSGKSTKGCNAAFLYAIYGAIHNLDWRDVPEKKKEEFKRLTASMRASGEFS